MLGSEQNKAIADQPQVTFATHPYLLCFAAWAAKWQDLWEDTINQRRISETEPQLQAWPQAFYMRCCVKTGRPPHTAGLLLQDIIMQP